jgi:site-specific DNA-cytosine methylase
VLDWKEVAKTVTGNARLDTGTFAVADPRDNRPHWIINKLTDKPPFVPVIVAEDGTWHRPLTTLELAALQSIPTEVDGKPLKLAGNSISGWRERIGNAVPVDTAEAIGVRMLTVLLESDTNAFMLSSGGAVWVEPARLDS